MSVALGRLWEQPQNEGGVEQTLHLVKQGRQCSAMLSREQILAMCSQDTRVSQKPA